jgi:hypothetical protein
MQEYATGVPTLCPLLLTQGTPTALVFKFGGTGGRVECQPLLSDTPWTFSSVALSGDGSRLAATGEDPAIHSLFTASMMRSQVEQNVDAFTLPIQASATAEGARFLTTTNKSTVGLLSNIIFYTFRCLSKGMSNGDAVLYWDRFHVSVLCAEWWRLTLFSAFRGRPSGVEHNRRQRHVLHPPAQWPHHRPRVQQQRLSGALLLTTQALLSRPLPVFDR